jgi:CheY-like chemotaxis protein
MRKRARRDAFDHRPKESPGMSTSKKQILPLIMIAEPDDDERRLLRAILKSKGFNVIEASDGEAAIEMAIERRPDLLLVDLELPQVSGSVAIRRIRKHPGTQRLPIVAVSTRHRYRRARLAGRLTAHLPTPIKFDELDQILDRFLPGRRLSSARV